MNWVPKRHAVPKKKELYFSLDFFSRSGPPKNTVPKILELYFFGFFFRKSDLKKYSSKNFGTIGVFRELGPPQQI